LDDSDRHIVMSYVLSRSATAATHILSTSFLEKSKRRPC